MLVEITKISNIAVALTQQLTLNKQMRLLILKEYQS